MAFEGIEFTFDSNEADLASGERIVVVGNQLAFDAVYDTAGIRIATGQYDDTATALINSGQTLTLLDSAGGLIQRFRYDDKTSEGWYDETDGGGRCLVFIDPTQSVDAWSDQVWLTAVLQE